MTELRDIRVEVPVTEVNTPPEIQPGALPFVPPQVPNSTSALLGDPYRRGDPVECYIHARGERSVANVRNVLFGASITAMTGLTYELPYITPEPLIVGAAVPGIPAFLVASGFVAAGKRVGKRQLKNSLEEAKVIREATGEEVDVIIGPKEGQGRRAEPALRWYAFDGNDKPPKLAVDRLKVLADYARDHKIERVVIGADWLLETDYVDKEACEIDERFGTLRDGGTAVQNLYRNKWPDPDKKRQPHDFLKDNKADGVALVATPDQLRALLADYKAKQSETTLTQLLDMIGDDGLTSLHDLANKGVDDAKQQLARRVERMLERQLDDGGGLHGVKHPIGGWVQKIRTSGTVRVHNGQISRSLTGYSIPTSRDKDDTALTADADIPANQDFLPGGTGGIKLPGENSSVVRASGYETAEELIANVLGQSKLVKIMAAVDRAYEVIGETADAPMSQMIAEVESALDQADQSGVNQILTVLGDSFDASGTVSKSEVQAALRLAFGGDSETEPATKSQVLAALHMTLVETDEARYAAGGAAGSPVESLFARMQARKSESFEAYHPRRRRLIKSLGMIAASAVLVGAVSEGVQYTVLNPAYSRNDEQVKAYNDAAEKADPSHKTFYDLGDADLQTEAYLKFLESRGSGAVRDHEIVEMWHQIIELDSKISAMLMVHLVDAIGWDRLKQFSFYTDRTETEWAKRIAKETPPFGETIAEDGTFIGDASGDLSANKTVFEVKSLTGKPTDGYYITQTNNALYVDERAGKKPFVGRGIEFGGDDVYPQDVVLPADQASIDALHPDFMVRTPYLGVSYQGDILGASYGGMILPVKFGTNLVGARIVDMANPSLVSDSMRITQHDDGTYHMQLYTDSLQPGGKRMEQPVLETYLKETPNAPIQAAGDIEIIKTDEYDELGDAFSEKELHEVASKTRRALGLPEDATPEQILHAISSKKYSYTPFARDHTKPIDLRKASDEEVLIEIGQTLAELETLNCNMAQTLDILATADKQEVKTRLATGFMDKGDGKLTQMESHAFQMHDKTIIDATPGILAKGEVDRSVPTDGGQMTPTVTHQNRPLLPLTAGGMLMAASAVMILRRRKQIGPLADKLVANLAVRGVASEPAIKLLGEALYAKPGVWNRQTPSYDPTRLADDGGPKAGQTMDRYIAQIPRGGISLSEAQGMFGARRWERRTTFGEKKAILMLGLADGAIRRTVERNKAQTRKKAQTS